MANMEEPVGGDETRGPGMIAVRAVTTAIATILIGLRLYIRFGIVKAPSWDDLTIVIALALSWAGLVIIVVCVQHGLGRHEYYLEAADRIMAIKINYIGQVILILSSMFTKLSICLFLLRLFTTSKRWRHFFYVLMAFIFVSYVVASSLILPQCRPMAKIWDPSLPGTCWPRRTIIGIIVFQGGIAILTDFVLALLPVVFLWNVHIKLKHKAGICVLMGLGIFTGVCAIVRSIMVRSLADVSDFTWTVAPLLIWSVLEANVAIIAATIPTLRILFSREIRSRYRQQGYSIYYTSRNNKASNDQSMELQGKKRVDRANVQAAPFSSPSPEQNIAHTRGR